MLGHLVATPFSPCQLVAHFSAEPLDVSLNGFHESSGSIPDTHTFSVESHSSELFRKRSCLYIEFEFHGKPMTTGALIIHREGRIASRTDIEDFGDISLSHREAIRQE
jgi:hypothetical protein